MTQLHAPTSASERAMILDIWRGFALLGIALANFPEFSLWSFMSPSAQQALPCSAADSAVHFFLYMCVDGKFYTLFSLLFGIGFSLILKRHSRGLFFRRMLFLALIGFAHLMFLWSGDILLLYAVCGMLLLLFAPLSDRWLCRVAAALLLLPVGLDAVQELTGSDWSAPFYRAWWQEADRQGITEENFANWLVQADSYPKVFAFLRQGAIERVWEFVSGHRLPKVLGLFVLGYLIGRNRLFARLHQLPIAAVCRWSLGIGLPLSALYAWSSVTGHPFGATFHSLLYTLSVYPTALGYACALALLYQRRPVSRGWTLLASPGRMALTCYILQTVAGIILFYGIGFALGCRLSLAMVQLVALATFLLETVLAKWWFGHFRFGPLEWIWRMLTYGRRFPLRNA